MGSHLIPNHRISFKTIMTKVSAASTMGSKLAKKKKSKFPGHSGCSFSSFSQSSCGGPPVSSGDDGDDDSVIPASPNNISAGRKLFNPSTSYLQPQSPKEHRTKKAVGSICRNWLDLSRSRQPPAPRNKPAKRFFKSGGLESLKEPLPKKKRTRVSKKALTPMPKKLVQQDKPSKLGQRKRVSNFERDVRETHAEGSKNTMWLRQQKKSVCYLEDSETSWKKIDDDLAVSASSLGGGDSDLYMVKRTYGRKRAAKQPADPGKNLKGKQREEEATEEVLRDDPGHQEELSKTSSPWENIKKTPIAESTRCDENVKDNDRETAGQTPPRMATSNLVVSDVGTPKAREFKSPLKRKGPVKRSAVALVVKDVGGVEPTDQNVIDLEFQQSKFNKLIEEVTKDEVQRMAHRIAERVTQQMLVNLK